MGVFYNPTSNTWEIQFLYIRGNIRCYHHSCFCHSGRCAVISPGGLNVHFWTFSMWVSAPCALLSSAYLLQQNISSSSAHFQIRFFNIQFLELFVYSEHNCFVEYMICKHSLPVCNLSSLFLNRVLLTANVFNFDEVQFINFSFYGWCSWYQVQEFCA